MRIKSEEAKVSQNFYREMFEKFRKSIEGSPFRLRTCPFSLIYSFFSYHRIDKKIARDIINNWVGNKWCERMKYHGLRF